MEEIKKKVEEIINKVKNDGDFANKFKDDPVKAVEGVVGMDLPDDQINNIVDMVKAKVNFDNNGIIGKITGLFNK
ncbi:MAG: hypothetical protein IJH12_03250 [Clostridia bacterium]|nr:hypothetical protein [Clostridia bacterium]